MKIKKMVKHIMLLIAIVTFQSNYASSAILTENFSEPFPTWETNWLGINSNLQNYYGKGSTFQNNFYTPGTGLWITTPSCGQSACSDINISFTPSFGKTLSSFTFDVYSAAGGVKVNIYDSFGTNLLSHDIPTNYIYDNVGITSSTGISGFEFISPGDQINGNLLLNHVTVSIVPIPAAIWLFGSGMFGLGIFGKRSKSS
jgi:hypothetical protein